jgi:hypothetical protein
LLQTKWWITLQWHFFEDWVVSKVSPSSTLSLLVAQEISISVLHHQLFHFSCWSDLCCTSIIHSFNFFCVCGRDLCCTVIIKLFGFRRWTSHANEARQLTTQQGHDDENRFHSFVFLCYHTKEMLRSFQVIHNDKKKVPPFLSCVPPIYLYMYHGMGECLLVMFSNLPLTILNKRVK